MSEIAPWLPWAILSAPFAALTAIFAKIGMQHIDSTAATLIRTVIIGVILLAIVLARDSLPPLNGVSARTYAFLVLSGLATGASWVCYFRALQLGDAARVAPIDKFSVILVAIMGAAFLGERLSTLNWVGVVVTSVGLLMVAMT
jgi:bacterial/archaeal transporter family protein